MMHPLLFASLTVIFWATVPVVGKVALGSVSGFQLLLYVFLFASIALAAIVAYQKKLALLRKYSMMDYGRMFLLGAFGFFGLESFYYFALSNAPAAPVAILNQLWPLFAILFASFLLGERISGRGLAAMLIAFVGAAFVIGPFSFGGAYFLGYALAVLSAVSEAFFVVAGKKYDFERYSSMLVYSLVVFLLSLVANILNSSLFIPPAGELLALAYLGVCGAGLAYAFLFRAMELGDTAKVVTFTYLSPFLALVLISVFLGEEISAHAFFGLALISAGILLQNGGKHA